MSLHRHEGGKFYPGTGAADEVLIDYNWFLFSFSATLAVSYIILLCFGLQLMDLSDDCFRLVPWGLKDTV